MGLATLASRPVAGAPVDRLRRSLDDGEACAWLRARLTAYYAPAAADCGTNFLDGTEALHPHEIVPADLLALTAVGVVLPPDAVRRLLHDTPHARAIAAALEALPATTELASADSAEFEAMLAFRRAVEWAVPADSPFAVDALCARKRPELFAPLGPAFRTWLGLRTFAPPQEAWLALRELVRDELLTTAVGALFDDVRAQTSQEVDVYPLRQFEVLAELLPD